MNTKTMITVFDLKKDLEKNPDRISLTQALTLNRDKPQMGLRGSHGLFGSAEWWRNIESGSIKTLRISGIIKEAYFAGQGETGKNNMIDLITEAGEQESVGIYLNNPADVSFFKNGHSVEIEYALDELKQTNPDGSPKYSRVTLNMRVSKGVVK